MQPAIGNFKRQKHSSGLKHPKNLGERLVLQFGGTQMVKHENPNR
jgi:hypothetical protein